MRAYLVRVGIDQAFGKWNAPIDPGTGDFVYIPIPEKAGTAFQPGMATDYTPFRFALDVFAAVHPNARPGICTPPEALNDFGGVKRRSVRQPRMLPGLRTAKFCLPKPSLRVWRDHHWRGHDQRRAKGGPRTRGRPPWGWTVSWPQSVPPTARDAHAMADQNAIVRLPITTPVALRCRLPSPSSAAGPTCSRRSEGPTLLERDVEVSIFRIRARRHGTKVVGDALAHGRLASAAVSMAARAAFDQFDGEGSGSDS